MTASRLSPLPVRPRPRRGETADSYLRRLAAANHLRFSYLRRYLAVPGAATAPSTPASWPSSPAASRTRSCGPSPSWPAAPRPGRGAARTLHQRRDSQRSHTAKREKYAAIRRDAAQRAHPGGRSSASATSAAAPSPWRSPPPSRPSARRSTASPSPSDGLHAHIDAMTRRQTPQIRTAAIWQRLADDHGTTVAYPTLRTYVSSRRRRRRTRSTETNPRQHHRPPAGHRSDRDGHRLTQNCPDQVSPPRRATSTETGQWSSSQRPFQTPIS